MSSNFQKERLSFVFKLFLSALFTFWLCFPVISTTWYEFPNFEKEGVEIGGEYVFVMDSFNGVNAYLNSKSNGKYDSYYQCTELVASYLYSIYSTDYNAVKDLNNSDSQGFSVYDFHPDYTADPPQPTVDKRTEAIQLTKVTEPYPGDIVIFKYPKRHVAIVKAVNGTIITLIEQNYVHDFSGVYKYTINRTINSDDSNTFFYRYPSPLWDVQIKSAWYYNYVHCLYGLGIISGDTGSFGPVNPISRAEFIKMVVLALEKVSGRNLANYCIQLPTAWEVEPEYYDYISDACLYKNNNPPEPIAFWDPNTLLDFSEGITRQEAAHVVRNALRLSTSNIGSYELTDVQACYYAPWVYDIWKIGIMNGFVEKNFNPLHKLNRAEAANIIINMLKHKEYFNNNCNVCPETCNND